MMIATPSAPPVALFTLTARPAAVPVQVRLPCHPRRRLFDWAPAAGGTVLYIRCRDCGQDWRVQLQPADNGPDN